MDSQKIGFLKEKAAEMRLLILEAVYAAQSGHPGGSLSCADILAYLYFEKLNVSPEKANDPDRDRFVLSKGHSCPALYAALALRGFFPEEDIPTFRRLGSYLQGHPDMRKIKGVDMSTGSLGQGFSAACGMAKAAKITGRSYRTYTIIGDGESEEGQIWEAAMFAAHYQLDNLTAFLDLNYLQIDGDVRDIMDPTPHDDKFRAFGWHVEHAGGHDFYEIDAAVRKGESQAKGKPLMVICRTVKGKGVSFMENVCDWHGKAPKEGEYQIAMDELTKNLQKIRGENA